MVLCKKYDPLSLIKIFGYPNVDRMIEVFRLDNIAQQMKLQTSIESNLKANLAFISGLKKC